MTTHQLRTSETLDADYLHQAVELSRLAISAGTGGPFGAVIVRDSRVIGRGRNRVTHASDPTAHAEIEAIRDACKSDSVFELSGCTIYSSCEPCPMCLGAIYWARLDRLVYANTRDQAAAIDFDDAAIYQELARPLAEQKLATKHLPLDNAQRVFEQWQASDTKIKY